MLNNSRSANLNDSGVNHGESSNDSNFKYIANTADIPEHTGQCKPSLNEISSKVEKQAGTVKMEKMKESSFKGNLNVEGSFVKAKVVKLLERHRDFMGDERVVILHRNYQLRPSRKKMIMEKIIQHLESENR